MTSAPHASPCMSLSRLICSPAHGGADGGIFDCLNRRLHLRCQMYAQSAALRALISHIEPHSPPPFVQLLIFGEFARSGRWKICQLPPVVVKKVDSFIKYNQQLRGGSRFRQFSSLSPLPTCPSSIALADVITGHLVAMNFSR